MTRLVVKMDDRGHWQVFDDTGQSLFSGAKLRAEVFARWLCAAEGGTVVVVSRTGEVSTEYAVAPWDAKHPKVTVKRRWRSRRERRRDRAGGRR